MKVGRVVDRQRRDAVVDQHADLGAAEDHRLGAACCEPGDGLDIDLAGLVADDAAAELVVDDAVEVGDADIGDDRFEAAGFEAVDVEALLHREARAEKPDALHAVGEERVGGRGRDVDEGHADPRGDGIGDDVHRVGGEADDAGALRFEAGRDGRRG